MNVEALRATVIALIQTYSIYLEFGLLLTMFVLLIRAEYRLSRVQPLLDVAEYTNNSLGYYLAALEETVVFYADPATYEVAGHHAPIVSDKGQLARDALDYAAEIEKASTVG